MFLRFNNPLYVLKFEEDKKQKRLFIFSNKKNFGLKKKRKKGYSKQILSKAGCVNRWAW